MHADYIDSVRLKADLKSACQQVEEWLKIGFPSDPHLPYHDQRAIELTAHLFSDFQPHVIIHGSDDFDFNLLGRFPNSPEDWLEGDALSAVRKPYLEMHNIFTSACSPIWQPAIIGNHNARYIARANQNLPALSATLTQSYKEMVERAGGAFYGWGLEGFNIKNILYLRHGISAGVNCAKSNLELMSYQLDVLAGHAHKFQSFTKTGGVRSVTSQVSGCLCQPASWVRGVANWQLGTVLTQVNLKEGYTVFHPVEYHKKGKRLSAIWGDKEYVA